MQQPQPQHPHASKVPRRSQHAQPSSSAGSDSSSAGPGPGQGRRGSAGPSHAVSKVEGLLASASNASTSTSFAQYPVSAYAPISVSVSSSQASSPTLSQPPAASSSASVAYASSLAYSDSSTRLALAATSGLVSGSGPGRSASPADSSHSHSSSSYSGTGSGSVTNLNAAGNTSSSQLAAGDAVGEPSASASASASASSIDTSTCSICGDKATGKHYGAWSCDGCKGFFRRSVRKRHTYQCRFDRCCAVERDKRNQCRACRFLKCISAGMQTSAVQNERDKISIKRPPQTELGTAAAASSASSSFAGLSIPALLQAELSLKQVSPSYSSQTSNSQAFRIRLTIPTQAHADMKMPLVPVSAQSPTLQAPQAHLFSDGGPVPLSAGVAASQQQSCNSSNGGESQSQEVEVTIAADGHVEGLPAQMPADECESVLREAILVRRQHAAPLDIVDAMHSQLLLMVEWCKQLPCFVAELSIDDQIALLRSHAAELLIFGVARRSVHLPRMLILANSRVIPFSEKPESDIYRVANRIIDELVRAVRELSLDDSEFVCLKAIIFFDPDARGLIGRDRVRAWRHALLLQLEEHIERNRALEARGRFGELLLLLPLIQNFGLQMVEQLQLAKLIGLTPIDSLLHEMLLAYG